MACRYRRGGLVQAGCSESERYSAQRLPPFPSAISFGTDCFTASIRKTGHETQSQPGDGRREAVSTCTLGNITFGRRVPLSEGVDAQRNYRPSHHEPIQMSTLVNLMNAVEGTSEHVLQYLEYHHWFFGFLLFGYLFRLHDRGVHARFSALDKRVDEIRKRIACDR